METVRTKYTSKEVREYLETSLAPVSPVMVMDILEENRQLKEIINEAAILVDQEDLALMRRMNKEALKDWRDRTLAFLKANP